MPPQKSKLKTNKQDLANFALRKWFKLGFFVYSLQCIGIHTLQVIPPAIVQTEENRKTAMSVDRSVLYRGC